MIGDEETQLNSAFRVHQVQVKPGFKENRFETEVPLIPGLQSRQILHHENREQGRNFNHLDFPPNALATKENLNQRRPG